jgi:DoxX-like family
VSVNARPNASRTRTITYWILTVGLAWELGFGGVSDLMRLQYVRVIVAHLGYPPYLLSIIGFWKVLAAIVLLVPRFPVVKEWAYAGSFFVFMGAAASHMAAGDGFKNGSARQSVLRLLLPRGPCVQLLVALPTIAEPIIRLRSRALYDKRRNRHDGMLNNDFHPSSP